jgi:tRNA U38,U39,U40 pseudouridine synthase TruA
MCPDYDQIDLKPVPEFNSRWNKRFGCKSRVYKKVLLNSNRFLRGKYIFVVVLCTVGGIGSLR